MRRVGAYGATRVAMVAQVRCLVLPTPPQLLLTTPLLLLASMPGSPGELLLPLRSHLELPWALRGGSLTKVSLGCAC